MYKYIYIIYNIYIHIYNIYNNDILILYIIILCIYKKKNYGRYRLNTKL